jgi:hypothetical protein
MTTLIHNKTNEPVMGEQYVQGVHPPPTGVTVTMGLHGVIAVIDTLAGKRQIINDSDWILNLPGVGIDIFTDTFVRKMYTLDDPDKPSEAGKPVKLG